MTEQHDDIYLVLARRFEPSARNNPEPRQVRFFHEFRWWSVVNRRGSSTPYNL